jgi:hypothetical protein
VNRSHHERLEAMRDAFASGRCAEGERLLTEALEDDLPWDRVTRAVAIGVGRRYGECRSERRRGGGEAGNAPAFRPGAGRRGTHFLGFLSLPRVLAR